MQRGGRATGSSLSAHVVSSVVAHGRAIRRALSEPASTGTTVGTSNRSPLARRPSSSRGAREGPDSPRRIVGLRASRLAGDRRTPLTAGLIGTQHRGEAPTWPLFFRFSGEPARRLVNRLSVERLAELIRRYGEERYHRRIAREIARRRREKPIETAQELAELVRRCMPRTTQGRRIDPATRTFQALRIVVNEELKSLEIALQRVPDCLQPQARMAVISFHSLEDRRVKEAFRDDWRLQVLTPKPARPAVDEVARNPRARSAKLRVAQRI